MNTNLTLENNKYIEAIKVEKILVAHRNTTVILAGNILGSFPISVVLWGDGYSTKITAWLGFLVSLLLVRLFHYKRLNIETASTTQVLTYGKIQTFLIFLTGCIWGAAGTVFFDHQELENIALLILTFVSMIASSLVSLASKPVAYILFSTPLMMSLIINMLIVNQPFYTWMGFGATVYLFVTYGFSSTIHKVIDHSLRLKYENLELIKDLTEQTDRANKASSEKSQFFASASHDLRQPLNAVNLFTEVLSTKLTDSAQKRDLGDIQQGLDSLNTLLDALFDVSYLDSGSVNAEKVSFNLQMILEKLGRQFLIETKIKGLDFNIKDCNLVIYSDPILLERVITNLLVNAVKYTETGKIELWLEEADNQFVRMHISDTGIGIAKDHIESIFNEFFQVNNPERNRKYGLGLGLAIVRRILDILNHPIAVTSELGIGTDVVITLPLSTEQPIDMPSAADTNDTLNAFNGLQIMIVDNEIEIVKAMQALLESWGSQCVTYSSTESALATIDSEYKPDVIITDYRMPGKHNGRSMIMAFRKVWPNIPALVVTGDTSGEVVEELRANQLDYLRKPVKPAQLRIILLRMLKRYTRTQR